MMEMGTSACEGDEKPDIILYHEFPLTGYISGERDEKLTKTIGVPGRETERLADLASHACLCGVGAYAHHPDWPKHILSLTTVINRQGEVVDSIGSRETSSDSIKSLKSRQPQSKECRMPFAKSMVLQRSCRS